ncbi:unnamed protein product [Leptidea sinapis]|uniref:Major facilitator superfamily (MFS) profile domain-containing protein n=1 Tax=Leptidea sinapis TaxID=189913 RepID=A0A5E4QWG0_9NEOP|nr:unnamed protein product [Leptidea sinapis]
MKIKKILAVNMKLEKRCQDTVRCDMETDLETALELAGAGKYQIFHCGLMVAILGSAILEMIGSSFILPSAACDLALEDHMKGIIASIPNIDALGRKPVLLVSTLLSGVIGLIAAFMPNLLSFALCKFVGSLFLSCPSSLGFAFAGELMPKKRRDLALLICNASLMLIASLCPNFIRSISTYLRPWRLLTMAYSMPLILSALWLTQAKESPKFLMMKGKPDEALGVLRHIFAFNNSKKRSDGQSCEAATSSKLSALALLKPPHLK